MKVKLDFGTELDVLSQKELDDSLGRAAGLWAQRAAGVEFMTRLIVPAENNSTATLTIPGPAQGYAWDVKTIVLVTSESQGIYVSWDSLGQYPVGVIPSANVLQTGASTWAGPITFGSHQVVLKPGRALYAQPVTGGEMLSAMLSAVQVPAERLGMFLS